MQEKSNRVQSLMSVTTGIIFFGKTKKTVVGLRVQELGKWNMAIFQLLN